jgi:hypothetical protein
MAAVLLADGRTVLGLLDAGTMEADDVVAVTAAAAAPGTW